MFGAKRANAHSTHNFFIFEMMQSSANVLKFYIDFRLYSIFSLSLAFNIFLWQAHTGEKCAELGCFYCSVFFASLPISMRKQYIIMYALHTMGMNTVGDANNNPIQSSKTAKKHVPFSVIASPCSLLAFFSSPSSAFFCFHIFLCRIFLQLNEKNHKFVSLAGSSFCHWQNNDGINAHSLHIKFFLLLLLPHRKYAVKPPKNAENEKKDGAKELKKKRRERGVKRLNWWQREWSCVRIKYTLFLSTLLIWQIHKLHITQLAAAALPLEKSISQVFVLPKKSLSPPILLRVRTLSVSVSRVQFLEKKMLKHNNNNHHDVDGGGGCDDEKEKERRNINLGAISMPVHDTDNWTTHTTLQIDHFV